MKRWLNRRVHFRTWQLVALLAFEFCTQVVHVTWK